MYDCHIARIERMLRWERYKGRQYVQVLRDNVYLTKEYMALAWLKNILYSVILSIHTRPLNTHTLNDVCVYRKDHLGTAKISEGTAIIMYFAEIKANEQ